VPNTRQHSKWACIFSLRWLFRDVGERDLEDEGPPGTAYLWTWTAPTKEQRLDPVQMAGMWRSMMRESFYRTATFVHVLECSKRGYWHYHGVTPHFWSVRKIREIGEYHGFGRINVRALPPERVYYVAKYLGKPQQKLPKGMRRWAAHGFTGVKSQEVHIETKTFDIVTACYKPEGLYDGWELISSDLGAFRVVQRVSLNGTKPNIMSYDLKPLAQKEFLALATSGKFLGLGEYRGCQVVEKNIWNEKTRANEARLLVEHTVEFGVNSQKVSEWLAPGTKRESVKPAANKGDLVMCVISQISRQYGLSCESIKPVSALV